MCLGTISEYAHTRGLLSTPIRADEVLDEFPVAVRHLTIPNARREQSFLWQQAPEHKEKCRKNTENG